ncbi:hypothetical protein [Streptosporangium minutum]|uniref:hypothetical protein n=1 Tax=Streptosporangium minutum TaxID=569862 RepID=UPI0013FDDED6|nr:hypothetical protein [Streptosporangium minutum]
MRGRNVAIKPTAHSTIIPARAGVGIEAGELTTHAANARVPMMKAMFPMHLKFNDLSDV